MSELEVRDLTVEFASDGYLVRPLDHLSFDADDGELVVVLGPSGCGKTTLLSCLAGLLTPTSGSITLSGEEVVGLTGQAVAHYRRHTVGVVFQAFNLLPSLSAKGNVMAPLRLAKTNRKQSAAARRRAARAGWAGRPGRSSPRADVGRPAATRRHRPRARAGPSDGRRR